MCKCQLKMLAGFPDCMIVLKNNLIFYIFFVWLNWENKEALIRMAFKTLTKKGNFSMGFQEFEVISNSLYLQIPEVRLHWRLLDPIVLQLHAY